MNLFNTFKHTSTAAHWRDEPSYKIFSRTTYPELTLHYQISDGTMLMGNLTADSAGNLYGIAATRFSYSSGDVFEITGSGFAVPEPSSLSLLAIGGVALLGRRREDRADHRRGVATKAASRCFGPNESADRQ